MDTGSRSGRVSHPILRLEVVDGDGHRRDSYRVFCRQRQESVAVGVCCACPQCDAIGGGDKPSVDCSIELPPSELVPDPLGERTAVAKLLGEGMLVLGETCVLRDALVMLGEGRHSVGIVDEDQTLIGIVHEMTAARAIAGPVAIGTLMSSAVAIHESVPVRTALRLLAGAHSREAIVVTSDGAPLGVFRDVDGMRWIAGRRGEGR